MLRLAALVAATPAFAGDVAFVVPEIDALAGVAAIACVAGVVALVAERRRDR